MSQAERKEYQETDSDSLPFGWQICKLGDLVTKVGSGVTPKGGSQFYLTSGVPLIRSQNVLWGKLDLSDVAYISVDQHLRMTNSALQPLDVLLNITGASIGRCAVLPECFSEGNVNQHVCIIRPADNLQPYFLSQYLNSQFGQEQILKLQAGGNREGLNYQQIRGFSITLPSLLEQKKIAAIISCVDNKLDVIGRQIETTQLLKQGLMQNLFSRGVGTQDDAGRWIPHNELKNSALGIIPESWTDGSIREYIRNLRSGVSVNAEDRQHGANEIGVLKVSCVSSGNFYPSRHKTVLPAEHDRVAEPVLQGRIIVSRANTPSLVGESAYVNKAYPNLFLPDKLWQVEPSKKPHSVKWLAFYLQCPFVRKQISKAASGTSGSMKNISKNDFLNINMPLVPIAEQNKIAEILSAVTSKIEVLKKKRAHYQTLKRGLMQKLLTGEWRVKIDDPTPTTEQ